MIYIVEKIIVKSQMLGLSHAMGMDMNVTLVEMVLLNVKMNRSVIVSINRFLSGII